MAAPIVRKHTVLTPRPAWPQAPERRLPAVPAGGRTSRSAREELALGAITVTLDLGCMMAGLTLMSAFWPGNASTLSQLGAYFVSVSVWLTLLSSSGVYGRRSGSSGTERVGLLSAASGALLIANLVMPSAGHTAGAFVGAVVLPVCGLLLLCRRALDLRIRQAQAEGRLCRRALIVGTDHHAVVLEMRLRTLGLTPVAFVYLDDGPPASHTLPLPIAGGIADLGEAIRRNDVSYVVAAPTVDGAARLEILRAARRHGARAHVATRDAGTVPVGDIDPIGMTLALALKPLRSGPMQARLKRGFDVTAALIGLLLVAPLLVTVAFAVLVTSGRPVLFRQKRITLGGRPFVVYKFRTMVVRSEARIDAGQESEILFFKNSDRTLLTPLGGFLRRFSIDELPQLWNVVRGDMSMVGPRPLPATQVLAHAGLMEQRHDRPAGVTGWWQVNGRSDVDADNALDMDLFYVDNWSFAFDLYILLKTMRAVVSRTGAY